MSTSNFENNLYGRKFKKEGKEKKRRKTIYEKDNLMFYQNMYDYRKTSYERPFYYLFVK